MHVSSVCRSFHARPGSNRRRASPRLAIEPAFALGLAGAAFLDVRVQIGDTVEVPAASTPTFPANRLRRAPTHRASTQVLLRRADVSGRTRGLQQVSNVHYAIHASNITSGQHYESMQRRVRSWTRRGGNIRGSEKLDVRRADQKAAPVPGSNPSRSSTRLTSSVDDGQDPQRSADEVWQRQVAG